MLTISAYCYTIARSIIKVWVMTGLYLGSPIPTKSSRRSKVILPHTLSNFEIRRIVQTACIISEKYGITILVVRKNFELSA